MTLVIALQGKEPSGEPYIVLGCDSRGVMEEVDSPTTRTEVNKYKKVFEITKHTGILVAGDAEKGVYLIDEFIKRKPRDDDGISTLAKRFSKFSKNEFGKIDNFALSTAKFFPNVDFIFAGMNKIKGHFIEPRIYMMRRRSLFSLSMAENFITDGHDLLANYFIEKFYKEEAEINYALAVVANAIYDTQRVNSNVGGPINISVITPSGIRPVDAEDYYVTWELQRMEDIVRGISAFPPK
jgi:20S proteasome alpha/beta subunit